MCLQFHINFVWLTFTVYMWLRCSVTGRWAWYFSTCSQYAQIAQYLNTFVRVVSLVWQGAVWLGAGHGTFFYIYTTCIIPEYSYTFVYYQHWCDLGAVWLGAGRDTQTFLAAYTTCSLSSDSPAKIFQFLSREELKLWVWGERASVELPYLSIFENFNSSHDRTWNF